MSVKPITISGQLLPGRDDRAIEFFKQPHVKKSEVIRMGINLFLDDLDHVSNSADINADILTRLTRIEKLLTLLFGGGKADVPQPEPKSDNPFSSASR